MKATAVGTTSGCVIWILAFGLVSLCLCPIAVVIGTLSTTLGADTVAGILGPYLCPDESTAEVVTFQTTTTDEFGNLEPATGYELQCVNAAGDVVQEGSPDFAFYWVGLLMLVSLVVAAGLAFLVAAPLGAFIARRSSRAKPASNL
ncbi:MAG: hypothetical protein IPM53_27360 [Anaerolineaceae bacterium]|nr:hypothetical protein [Anaerolineaceae bacterium]